MTKTYEITQDDKGNIGILCLICHLTSYNQNDVEKFYCGKCKIFHEDHDRMQEFKRQQIKSAMKKILWMARRYADGRQTYAPDMFNDAYDTLRAEFGDDIDLASTLDEERRPVYDISLKNSHLHPYAVDGYKDEFSRKIPRDSQLVESLKKRKFYVKPKLAKD